MKLFYYLLFFSSLFFISSNLAAQCTGCTTTISTNINVSVPAGTKVCITYAGTFTGDIGFSGDGTLCVSSATTISNSINMNFNGNNNSIQNHGTWNKNLNLGNSNSTFNNFGTFSVGSLIVGNANTFTSTTNVTVTGSTQLANNAIMNVIGNFSTGNYEGGSNSVLNVSGNMNAVNITTGGQIVIDGTTSVVNVTTNGGGSILFGSSTTIAGTVQNNGNMQFNGDATIGGSFTNNGSGDIILNNSTISIGGAFANNGDITALGSCGRINIAGSSVNNGSGNIGIDDSNVDICGNTGGGFDVDNGNSGANVTNCKCVPTLLPITLTSFTAKKENNNKIHIDWKTIFELDNDYFEIERSFSGTDFIVITQINPQDNNEKFYKERNYVYIDNLTDNNSSTIFSNNQNIYYRLKQVDTNGDFSYSPVVSVQLEKQNNEEIKAFFLQNEWKLQSQNPIQVKVYSSIGLLKGVYDLNQNKNLIPISNFSKGMYILHIQDSKTSKITILKIIK